MYRLPARLLVWLSCCTPHFFAPGAYQTMEFLSQRDIAAKLNASLHMSSDEVSPALNDVGKIPLVTSDRAVGIVLCLLDTDCTVVYGDKPTAHLVDIEKIGTVDTAQKRLVLLHPVEVEDFPGGLRHVV